MNYAQKVLKGVYHYDMIKAEYKVEKQQEDEMITKFTESPFRRMLLLIKWKRSRVYSLF